MIIASIAWIIFLWTGCGGALTKHSQSISSPRYPDYPYPNSMQCDWVITMPRGKFIRLEFSDFEVEFNCDGKCWCADRLELWEGPEFNETKLGRWHWNVIVEFYLHDGIFLFICYLRGNRIKYIHFVLTEIYGKNPSCESPFGNFLIQLESRTDDSLTRGEIIPSNHNSAVKIYQFLT